MYAIVGLLLLSVGVITAQPVGESNIVDAAAAGAAAAAATTNVKTESSIWDGTPMHGLVQQYRDECLQQPDSSACIKVKVLNFVDELLGKNVFQAVDGVSIVPNENQAKEKGTGRNADASFLDQLENYITSHDLIVKTPPFALLQGATIKLSPRNLDDSELNMSLKLQSENEASHFEDRGRKKTRRKSKLRKILVPILVFVLLKAMTLIPLAIGVLSLKAWNALQLSFISFLVSISLAIFQLCKKVAHDSGSPITSHIPFETSHYAAARNFVVSPQVQNTISDTTADVNAQSLAYRGYAAADNNNLS